MVKKFRIRSIKAQLILGFSLIFLLMIGLLLSLNQWFLDDYFLYRNRVNMEEQATTAMEEFEVAKYSEILEELSRTTGGEITVYNQDYSVYLNSETSEQHQTLPRERLERMVHEAIDSDSNSYFTTLGQGDYKDQRIHYIAIMPDGRYMVIDKGLGLIDEAGDVFILFLWIGCIAVYFIGLILIYQFADRFTRPIIKLKKNTERIAKLDFNDKYRSNRDDEIGKLVNSVDTMADSLEETIIALNISSASLEKELSKERNLEKMRRQFTANVSHELKNPISMIIGYADGIERGIAKTDEDRMYYAGVIKEEGKRMNRLVKDLLDLSSYQSGTFTLEKANLDVAELFYSSLGKYRDKAKEKDVEVKVSGEGSVMVYGDRDRLEQVFTNLMDNGFKHVNDGGCINGNIELQDSKVKFELSNTGNLIPEDAIEKIWESFYQVDTDTDGNGLGLTIVKKIVELHDGYVDVEIKNEMNVFSVVLPLVD